MAINEVSTEQKHEKQMQAMIYAIENYPQINRTKLMKFIFFVDLYAMNRLNGTIFEDKYEKLQNGPVPKFGFKNSDISNDYFNVVRKVDNDEYYHYEYSLKENIHHNEKIFDDLELQLMKIVLDYVKYHDTNVISEYTHSFNLWIESKNHDLIPLSLFELDKKQLRDFEVKIGTRIYVNAEYPPLFTKLKPKIDSLPTPKKLPEFIDEDTGIILK